MMADVALDDMDVPDDFAAFTARCGTRPAEMLPAFAAAEQMRRAVHLAAQMARFGAIMADEFSAFGAFADATCPADLFAADMARLKTGFADRMFAAFAQADGAHLVMAGRTFGINRLPGK